MRLIEVSGSKVSVAPETLLIVPFKTLWERDTSQSKGTALKELGFVSLMASSTSPYAYIADAEQRQVAVKTALGLNKRWKPDKEVTAAVRYYSETFTTSSALLLNDMRVVVDKLREVLKNIDLNKTDSMGKPLYTLSSIITAVKQVPQLIREIDAAERAVKAEEPQTGKMRGSGEKSLLDDGLDILGDL